MNNVLLSKPLVSIVMATYNGAAFIEEQVNSLLTQTYGHFELLIADDCSTDDTAQKLQKLSEADKRITCFYNKENIGVNKNFEQLLYKVSGSFIAIADQDDIWHPTKIEMHLQQFSSKEIVLVHAASLRFSGVVLPSKQYIQEKQFEGNDVKKLLLRNSVSGHNMMFRATLLHYILPIPVGIYYDWWIVQTATCYGLVAASNKVLAYQRVHNNNVTVQKQLTKYQTQQQFIERQKALQIFSEMKGLSVDDLLFINQLKEKYELLNNRTYSNKLFQFLLKHGHTLFYYKKGLFKFFSVMKAAKRLSYKV